MLRWPPISQPPLPAAILGIFLASLAGPAKAQLPGRFMFGPEGKQIKQCNIDGSNCFNVVQYGQVNTGNPPEASQPSIASNGTIAFDAVFSRDGTCVPTGKGICVLHILLLDPVGRTIVPCTSNH